MFYYIIVYSNSKEEFSTITYEDNDLNAIRRGEKYLREVVAESIIDDIQYNTKNFMVEVFEISEDFFDKQMSLKEARLKLRMVW